MFIADFNSMVQNYTYITNTMSGYCLLDSKITFNFAANIVFAS